MPPGQACCGQVGTSFPSCQQAPCPIDQFCSTSAECLQPGYECRSSYASSTPTMVCAPALEAGTGDDGSPILEDGSPEDAIDEPSTGDGASTDGPLPGDGASDGSSVPQDAADARSDSGATDGSADAD